MYNFIESCLRGYSLSEDIDDYIDQWHEGNLEESIYVFLGMSRDEYAAWIEQPDLLPFIITAHKRQINYKEALSQVTAMAARADSIIRSSPIQTWLEQQELNI